MTLQVLIAAMHQTDHSLLEKMNIQTDAIVVNQCDRDEIERFEYNGHVILWISMNERGVGLSRNTAFMRATADIVLFADEDVVYTDGYEKMILDAYENNPEADMLLFDLITVGSRSKPYRITEKKRVRIFNALKFGTFRFSCKREKAFQVGLSFNLLFGGGTKHSFGEDTLFLSGALEKGLKVWTDASCIGTVNQTSSSWFKGYNEKYFYDLGVLMKTAFDWKAYPLIVMLIIKNKNQTADLGLRKAVSEAFKGAKRV